MQKHYWHWRCHSQKAIHRFFIDTPSCTWKNITISGTKKSLIVQHPRPFPASRGFPHLDIWKDRLGSLNGVPSFIQKLPDFVCPDSKSFKSILYEEMGGLNFDGAHVRIHPLLDRNHHHSLAKVVPHKSRIGIWASVIGFPEGIINFGKKSLAKLVALLAMPFSGQSPFPGTAPIFSHCHFYIDSIPLFWWNL